MVDHGYMDLEYLARANNYQFINIQNYAVTFLEIYECTPNFVGMLKRYQLTFPWNLKIFTFFKLTPHFCPQTSYEAVYILQDKCML